MISICLISKIEVLKVLQHFSVEFRKNNAIILVKIPITVSVLFETVYTSIFEESKF